MNSTRLRSTLAAAVVLCTATIWIVSIARSSHAERGPSSRALRTGAVREIVLAVPFELEHGYPHEWRRERPVVSSGWLMVLDVDPELARARETAEPVLCVGDETAERVSRGDGSGRIVVLVPARGGDVPLADVVRAPVWFASPELPERVDARWIASERNAVDARAFDTAEIEKALARGGAPLVCVDRAELEYHAGVLVQRYSPQEADLAQRLMSPVTR